MTKITVAVILTCFLLASSPSLAFEQTRVIVYERPDGGVTSVSPAPNNQQPGESDDDFLLRVIAEAVPPDATNVEIILRSNLPSSDFHNAWVKTGIGPPTVDMVKAREIHAERIAVAQAADIAYLKVEERKERLRGNTTKADAHAATAVALEALNLNTLATQIGNAPNATALRAIWPAELRRP